MALNFHAVKVVHFIPFLPVHLKPLQVVHLFRCTHIKGIEDEISKLQGRIDKAMDAYLDNEITAEEKQGMVTRYNRDIARKEQQLETLKTANKTKLEPKLGYAISLINNMKWVVEDAPTEAKLGLLSSMFPQKIVYDGESYRTAAVNKVLDLIYQQTNELRGSKKVREGKTCALPSVVPGTGLVRKDLIVPS